MFGLCFVFLFGSDLFAFVPTEKDMMRIVALATLLVVVTAGTNLILVVTQPIDVSK
jgi:hypothetical protein